MKIKDIGCEVTDCGLVKVTYFEVKNDIDVDFICIAEQSKYVDVATLQECESLNEIYEVILDGPEEVELVKEHVYDCPIAIELEYFDARAAIECIHQL